VRAFLDADAQIPRDAALPRPPEREVARVLAERREFPVREVVEVLAVFGQSELVVGEHEPVQIATVKSRSIWDRLFFRGQAAQIAAAVAASRSAQTVFAPMPRTLA
jgi:hypothetical protein